MITTPHSDKVDHPAYRPDIDGLRALAVTAVVAYHAAGARVPGGFVGVDVFFVISGFLISSILMKGMDRGTHQLSGFYARRIRRIFPALAVVLAGVLVLGWFLCEPAEYAALGKHVAGGGSFIANVLLWRESGYFDQDASVKPLLHLWSLGVEEQFYLAWPLMLAFSWKKLRTFLPAIAAIAAVSFAINLWQIRSDPAGAFYLPFSRFWELLAGAAVASIASNHSAALDSLLARKFRGSDALSLGNLLSVAGAALIGIASFRFHSGDLFPGFHALVPVMGAVMLILAGTDALVNRYVLSNRAVVFIGLISYPLYLWHWPLLVFARASSWFAAAPHLTVLATIAFAVLLSVATYELAEKPVRSAYLTEHGRMVAGLATTMFVVVAVGALIRFNNGISARYPVAVRPLLEYKFDHGVRYWDTQCLLEKASDKFPADCTASLRSVTSERRMIVWGDSHGAMLTRSLQRAAPIHGVAVGQLASGHCAPVLVASSAAYHWCNSHSEQARSILAQLRPGTVVLAAAWMATSERSSLDGIVETVKWLRQTGVKRIILVGPEPDWHKPLPITVARVMRERSIDSIPARLSDGLSPHIEEVDAHARAIARAADIEYISPFGVFCDTRGCMTTVGVSRTVLTAWDTAHLTPEAADYLVNAEVGRFFPIAPQRW